jgi:uncharacterized membrane protein
MQSDTVWNVVTNPLWRNSSVFLFGVVMGLIVILYAVAWGSIRWRLRARFTPRGARLFDIGAIVFLPLLLFACRSVPGYFTKENVSVPIDPDVLGYVFLAVCAAVLVGLTLWTYLGAAQTTPRRLFILIFLRLLALIIAMITAIRPALSVIEQPRIPSTIIIVLDNSESMTLTDEFGRNSRWEVLKSALEKCEPILKQLQGDQEVTVHIYCFSNNFEPNAEQYRSKQDDKDFSIPQWLNGRRPDGKRTDFGLMLQKLYDRYQSERYLRGLIIVSDGGNNVASPDAAAQATKWRGIGCPIYTFMVGRTDTKSDQKDIALTSIAPDPSPVAVKADLIVKGTLNAQGLELANVKIRLTVSTLNGSTGEWEEIRDLTRTEEFKLLKSIGNEIEIATKAPDKPGEVRVKLEIINPPPADTIKANNEIDTYLTVTKEGVRVLVIDRARLELKYLRDALASDKRFNMVQVIRQTSAPPAAGDERKFDVLNEAYDAIIIGDVSLERLATLNPKLVENIEKLVREKGVGLLMTGGIDSFGGTPGITGQSWRDTPIGNLLPVEIPEPTPQVDASTEIKPTLDGFGKYIMKLDPDPKKNAKIWADLGDLAYTRLGGYTFIGKPKATATPYATARRVGVGGEEHPLLVGHDVGKGRVLAFGADQTWKWVNFGSEETPKNRDDPTPGQGLHARFWKQMVLWLAHQEEIEGNVFVRPDLRRLSVNGKNTLRMGIKDKHTDLVLNPKLRYQVLAPGEKPDQNRAKPPERADKGEYRATYEPKEPGEYRVLVWGEGKDPDGTEIKGDAESRFIVYPDISDELLRPAARDDFLLGLENTANGVTPDTVRRADKLPGFLEEEFLKKPLKLTTAKPRLHPDWRRNGSPWFLPTVLIIFVVVLSLEWGLRRVWGMV